MSKSQVKSVVRRLAFDSGPMGGSASPISPMGYDGGADLLRLKAALKKAVAKTAAPAYLIDAIRREVRK